MCMPACSSDNGNKDVPLNYIVQATVSVEDDGPVAYASVMDGDENLIDTLNLTINGEPMSIEYDGANGESTETGAGYPYYTMDLPDLKGGDMVVFEARDQFGAIIYAPEPAIIPTAIELLEPQESQELMAGDEVRILWTGGEAEGVVYGAGYESLDGESRYFTNTAQSQELTVPAGQTQQGSAVFGAGATTGETKLLTLTTDELMQKSYFFVSTASAISLNLVDSTESIAERSWPAGCPRIIPVTNQSYPLAMAHCTAEIPLTLGISLAIWNNRKNYDGDHGCTKQPSLSSLIYCTNWRAEFHPMAWVGCCSCKKSACPG